MQVFPLLPGISWPVKRAPVFKNIIQTGITGQRTAVRQQFEPRWAYELEIEFVRNKTGFTEFSDLLSVFQNCYGTFLPFLFNDIYDNHVADQTIGFGNGTINQFFLQRSLGGFNQRIAALNGSPVIKVAGITSSATIDSFGVVTLPAPPASGQAVTWTGNYYWICRFAEDQLDLSQFLPNYWDVKSVKFDTEIITG